MGNGLAVSAVTVDRDTTFQRLAEFHLDRSYRLACVLLGDRQDAEDAVQDALFEGWRHRNSLRDPSRFDAWFQRILVNECRQRLRARAARRALRPLSEPAAPDGASERAERDALRRALAGLSADHRIVVALRFFADLPMEEIAARTGTRLGTVKSRLHYALEALRAAYEAGQRVAPEDRR